MTALAEPVAELEQYRAELTRYCHGLLGSGFEADDAVQETLVGAWRAFPQFEGRSSLRSWLYRIATNVCRDMLSAGQRRAVPTPLGEDESGDDPPGGLLASLDGDPADIALGREAVRLAFVTAFERLPPRQRAVLILRDVLRWRASEVAGLLGTSVASVNSSLQRARAAVAARRSPSRPAAVELDDQQQELLTRYVEAFERHNVTALTDLLRYEVTR